MIQHFLSDLGGGVRTWSWGGRGGRGGGHTHPKKRNKRCVERERLVNMYRRVPRGEREGKVRAASRDLAAKTNETRSELNPKVERDEEMKGGGGAPTDGGCRAYERRQLERNKESEREAGGGATSEQRGT